jgi:hypothetical protein
VAAEELPPVPLAAPPVPVTTADPPVAVTAAPPVPVVAAPPVARVPPTLPPAPLAFIVDEPQPITRPRNTNHSNPIPEIDEARRIDMARTPFLQKTPLSGKLLITRNGQKLKELPPLPEFG